MLDLRSARLRRHSIPFLPARRGRTKRTANDIEVVPTAEVVRGSNVERRTSNGNKERRRAPPMTPAASSPFPLTTDYGLLPPHAARRGGCGAATTAAVVSPAPPTPRLTRNCAGTPAAVERTAV